MPDFLLNLNLLGQISKNYTTVSFDYSGCVDNHADNNQMITGYPGVCQRQRIVLIRIVPVGIKLNIKEVLSLYACMQINPPGLIGELSDTAYNRLWICENKISF